MLKVWLPLNGDLRNQGISNSNNIISNNSSVVNTGKIGKCMKITSNTDLQYIPNFNQYGLSLSGWFKINQNEVATVVDALNYTSTAYAPTGNLFGNTNYGGIGLIWIGNNHYSSGTFSYITAYAALRTPSVNQITAGASIEFDTWIHLTLTWDPTTHILSLYKNGNLINSKTFTAFTDGVARTLYLNYKAVYGGNGPTANIPLYCNDIRVYDNCLSAAEVKEISQGLVLHYKLDAATQSQTNLVPCGTTYTKTSPWTITTKNIDGYKWVTNSAFEATPSTTYTISVECDGTLSTGHGPGGLSIDQKPWSFWLYICNVDTTKSWQNGAYDSPINLNKNNYNYRKIGNAHVWTYTLSNTQKYISLRTNAYSDGTNNITINWWNMKIEKGPIYTPWGNENYIIQDSSGYGHNGEILNGPLTLTTDTPRYNICTHIGATNQKIKISNFPTSGFGNSYTFAWWAKISSVTPMHWGFYDGIRLNGMYTGRLWNTGDSSNNPLYNPGTTTQVTAPTINVWHHWVMTGDGTKCRVYQDGELWAEAKTYKAISGTTIYINGWNANTDYSSNNYSISDFRVYCTPLLDTDVKQLYNVSMKVDKSQNIHTFEINEKNINIFSSTPWTNNFNNHSPNTNPFTNYNSNNEPQFTTNSSSAGSDYIVITPGIYEWDYTVSINAGNQFYIGFERYDADKTSRSNAATVYQLGFKPSEDLIKKRFFGTVDLSTDGVNPIKYIALRILNGWSGTTSGVTGQATIHNFSLRLQSAAVNPKITKTGQLIGDEFKEYSNAKFYKDHIIEAKQFIER